MWYPGGVSRVWPLVLCAVSMGCLSAAPHIAVEIEVTGPGRILVNEGEAVCTDRCVLSVRHGAPLQLSAESAANVDFIQWDGVCPGSATPTCSYFGGSTRIAARFAGPGDVEWIIASHWAGAADPENQRELVRLDTPGHEYIGPIRTHRLHGTWFGGVRTRVPSSRAYDSPP